MKDILIIERVQHCATKYILNDYTSCSYYFHWCTCLNFMTFYLLLNLLRHPPISSTSPISYIKISSASTRSGANNKLILPHHLNNTSQHSYFHWLPSLWNTMPIFLIWTWPLINSNQNWNCINGNTSWIILMSTITVPYIISALAQDVTNLNLPLLTWLTYSQCLYVNMNLLLVFCLFVINSRLLAQVTSSLLVCLHHKANNEAICEIRPISLHQMSKQIDFLKKYSYRLYTNEHCYK